MEETDAEAKKSGLIKGTPEWDLRWSFKCPSYFSEDKQTKYCAALDPMKFSTNQNIPICDLTSRKSLNASFRGISIEQYISYLDQDLPCDAEGCANCLLNEIYSLQSCTVFINPDSSTLATEC